MKILKSSVMCGALAGGLLVLNPAVARAQTLRLTVALTASLQNTTTNITGGEVTWPPTTVKINNATIQAVATNIAHVLSFPAGSFLAVVNGQTGPFVAWVDKTGTNVLANLRQNIVITQNLSVSSGTSYTNGASALTVSSDAQILLANVPNPGDEATLHGTMKGSYSTTKFNSAGTGLQLVTESYNGAVAGSGAVSGRNAIISGTVTAAGSGKVANQN